MDDDGSTFCAGTGHRLISCHVRRLDLLCFRDRICGDRGTSTRNFTRMRLRELTMAEEQYYNETNAYTTDQSKLQLARRTGDVVVMRVTFAGPAGWSAEATHPAMPSKSCVTYAGPGNLLPQVPATMSDHTQPLGERDLECDRP